jgi:DNA-binding Lrp family transcriptional regulator
MVSTVVLIRTDVGVVNEVANALVTLKGVSEVYSVAGNYDIIALVQVRDNDDLAELVSNRIRKQAGIVATQTLIAFRVYTPADLDAAYSLGIES